MMANEKAFPQTITAEQDRYDNMDSGMDLRDYFAIKVLQTMLPEGGLTFIEDRIIYSKEAYEMADAMMEARKC